MFDYISGTLQGLQQNRCVVEHNGIGWDLTVSAKCAARLSGKQEVKVYTYLSLGSSDRPTVQLFGFFSPTERQMFHHLTDVSGIGPKAAISVLSVLDPEELAMCVLAGDAKALTAAPGIGLKGAQKIILELKDKIGKTGDELPKSALTEQKGDRGDLSEAVNALVVLGYQPQVAASAVRSVADRADSLQDMIRLALKSLGES